MQKKIQTKPRSLPGLVLLPMPEGLKKWRREPPQPRGAQVWVDDEVAGPAAGEPLFRTTLRSGMDDLYALVALIRGFTSNGGTETIAILAWLEDLNSALDSMDQDLESGAMDGEITIDDMSALDQLLDQCAYIETAVDGAEEPFPWNMLNFWLREIERRGRELIDVAIGSVVLKDYQAIGRAVKSLKYPLA